MELSTSSSFLIGSLVTWSEDIPESWRFIYTSGPMTVVSVRWDDGIASEYSEKFGGISREPGWIINVEYNADSTTYYDPPLSLLCGVGKLQKEIHQRWLNLSQ